MCPSITPEDPTRGILNPAAGLQRFELHRHAPAPDLARLVDWHWVVRWSLTAPFEQEVLPHPCVNLAIEAQGSAVHEAAGSPGRKAQGSAVHEAAGSPGRKAQGSAVHGIGTRRQVVRLEGTGRVVATKFKPGGFFPFSPLPMHELVDRVVPLAEIFGGAAEPLVRAVLDEPDDALALRAVEELLRARKGPEEAGLDEAMALAARAQADRDIHRVEDLARIAGTSIRTLHRAFDRYIGVGPKWVIRRSRVQEAAERVAAGAPVAWAALAAELGYHDQAHLIRDFKAQVGFTPGAYAERCAAARSSGGAAGVKP